MPVRCISVPVRFDAVGTQGMLRTKIPVGVKAMVQGGVEVEAGGHAAWCTHKKKKNQVRLTYCSDKASRSSTTVKRVAAERRRWSGRERNATSGIPCVDYYCTGPNASCTGKKHSCCEELDATVWSSPVGE